MELIAGRNRLTGGRRLRPTHLRGGLQGRAAFAVLLALPLAGCTGDEPEGASGTVRDSAGVRVIDLPAPATAAPRIELQVDPGWTPAPGHEFGSLVDVEPMEGGGVALLDAFDARVLVLDADGGIAARFGGEGSGPGEFAPRGLQRVVATGGSLVVPDLVQQRLSAFSPAGELLDTRPFPGGGGYALDWRAGPDGGLAYRLADPEGDRILVDHGTRLDTLWTFPAYRGEPNLLLPPVDLWDLQDGWLLLGRSDSREVVLREVETGAVVWVARWPGGAPPFTESDRVALEEALVTSATRQMGVATMDSASRAALLRQVRFPAVRPVLSTVLLVPDGEIWLRPAAPVEDMGPEAMRVASAEGYGGAEWEVLGGDGLLRRRVRLPTGFTVRGFSVPWVYGILEDETGVARPARLEVPWWSGDRRSAEGRG